MTKMNDGKVRKWGIYERSVFRMDFSRLLIKYLDTCDMYFEMEIRHRSRGGQQKAELLHGLADWVASIISDGVGLYHTRWERQRLDKGRSLQPSETSSFGVYITIGAEYENGCQAGGRPSNSQHQFFEITLCDLLS